MESRQWKHHKTEKIAQRFRELRSAIVERLQKDIHDHEVLKNSPLNIKTDITLKVLILNIINPRDQGLTPHNIHKLNELIHQMDPDNKSFFEHLPSEFTEFARISKTLGKQHIDVINEFTILVNSASKETPSTTPTRVSAVKNADSNTRTVKNLSDEIKPASKAVSSNRLAQIAMLGTLAILSGAAFITGIAFSSETLTIVATGSLSLIAASGAGMLIAKSANEHADVKKDSTSLTQPAQLAHSLKMTEKIPSPSPSSTSSDDEQPFMEQESTKKTDGMKHPSQRWQKK